MTSDIYVGNAGIAVDEPQYLLSRMGNRHGLIAGATGTGKTVTLQVMAEELSNNGIPVFMADIKGDISGICMAGSTNQKAHSAFQKRADLLGIDLAYQSFPVTFWDVFGEQGTPIKASLWGMGPSLISSMFELTQAQTGTMNVAFKIADERNLPLSTLGDLRNLLKSMVSQSEALSLEYGNVTAASVGAIQRQLLMIEMQGGMDFFSPDPANIETFMILDAAGKGYINVLAADKLVQNPKMYAMFLLWMLDHLFKQLPEVGNPPKPKMVFFFDEAHLLFDLASKPLLRKIEQIVRLIRSKGVGIYFVTQKPNDVPDDVLSQLGNRVQHALRAFTGADRRELKRAAETYRSNPDFDIAEKIASLGVGEAITSFLDERGSPRMAEHTFIRPPFSHVGPATPTARARCMSVSLAMPKDSKREIGKTAGSKSSDSLRGYFMAGFYKGYKTGSMW